MNNQHSKDPIVAWCSEPKCSNPIGFNYYNTFLYQRVRCCQVCLSKKGWSGDKKSNVDFWKRGN